MGILDSFEKGLERAVNGAFAKTFRSGVQPVEITAALRRELDTRAAVVSRDRILVPNRFTVRMSAPDHNRMSGLGPTLVDELTDLVQKHATGQGYSFAGPVIIRLAEDSSLTEGVLQVDSKNIQGDDVIWAPVLEIDGRRHALAVGTTVIGRGRDADITVEDTGTSRRHVEVSWDGRTARARDLGSTNGSTLDGRRIGQAVLEPESTLQIGRTRIVFRVVPQTPPPAADGGDDSTRRHDGFWGPSS